ncbi:AAA family ATPase [Scytonema sp. UIC 10036]|uniref:ATP-binding protein n=1 Tax=Scytonema sp. UIC 10036 TaxID=2304196 RepID=UPI001FAAD175|nr:AAA family ATPase [Scytonema sp. UIC 10036]
MDSKDKSKYFWEKLDSPSDSKAPIQKALNFLDEQLQSKDDSQADRQHTYLLPEWSTFIKPDTDKEARQLKELVIALDQKRPRPRMSLIVVGAYWSIPVILRNSVHILDLALPNAEELYESVFQVAADKKLISHDIAKSLSKQAQGMPFQAAEQVGRLIKTRDLWLNPQEAGRLLVEVKKQEIRKTGVLEYDAPQGQGFQNVGGLEEIKKWVKERKKWFEQDTLQPKLRPRAILLEGYPGCGKTFIAKAIAQEWGVPQINFEISRLQAKYVGESESNTYQALRAIEASAPNLLFIDEIEKAFSGVGGDSSGVSTRQFGMFLSWLNDHNYPIFVIATSNDRSKLPPELFRAGRFDEIFIVMPPNTKERREIIQTKAKYYELLSPIDESTLNDLANKTRGFSGAELDKLVKETVYWSDGLSPTHNDWIEVVKTIQPQYLTPKMQTLLNNYLKLIDSKGGRSASSVDDEDPDFPKNLIMQEYNYPS